MPQIDCEARAAKMVKPLQIIISIGAGWLLVAAATAVAAFAAPAAPGRLAPTNIDEVGRGSLLLQGDDDRPLNPAIELSTVVEVDVSGIVARTVVRQLFQNPASDWSEGIYVFPLPENAAVDTLRLRIGDRFIEGKIEERQKARAIYEQAKSEGRKSALLTSERPNIFTTAVANIGPGEAIAVEIHYQERLRYKDGSFRLRFPMVVGPRFIPGAPRIAEFTSTGWAAPTHQVADADRITPPVRHPSEGPTNPVALSLRLNAGFDLAELKSHHHPIDVVKDAQGVHLVTLKEQVVPADRDFELTWAPVASAAPQAGLFVERRDNGRYVLAMLMPPTDLAERTPGDADRVQQPRELIFVVDVSGSMAGASIVQAKAALSRALGTLTPADRFNVIAFNNDYRRMFASARAANADALDRAQSWIDALEADGGTNMAPALHAALNRSSEGKRLRQIVFLTDGAVGNEAELFRLINRRLGSSRLFTVGIGSAPNSHFMRGAARAGRGSFTHIGAPEQVAARIDSVVKQLKHPAITNISVTVDDGGADPTPDPIPDLYIGEPVVFAAQVAPATTSVTVSGRAGRRVWQREIDITKGQSSPGIARLWAREKISDFEAERLIDKDPEAVDAGILQLALAYGLVTRLTSLVAVDVTPSRPVGAPITNQELSTNLPAGWEFDKVFGEKLRTLRDAVGPVPVRKAVHDGAASSASQIQPIQLASVPVQLPGAATPSRLLIGSGVLLLLFSGCALIILFRQKVVA